MKTARKRVRIKPATAGLKPSSYQPSKAELEEDVSINASPEAVARAIMRGGAAPRDHMSKTARK